MNGENDPMAEISAALVKQLRDKTGLPMMECKKALQEAGGDQAAAEDYLRKQGIKTQSIRGDRATTEGRIAIFTSDKAGAMIELLCESAPVTNNDAFQRLCSDCAKQLATGPGASSPDELLKQPSPSRAGMTLGEQKDELFNQIREVFKLNRILRYDGPSTGYVHHDGKSGVLVEVKGGSADLGRDVAMHIAAMKPKVLNRESLEPAAVAKEREILTEAARKEGKPDNIIEKMIEGRMRNFYAEHVLLDQPFVKDDKTTVGKHAQAGGATVVRFERWQLG
jgi:elongation factor Ts